MLRHYLLIAVVLAIGMPMGYALLMNRGEGGSGAKPRDYLTLPVRAPTYAQSVDDRVLAPLREQLQAEAEARALLHSQLEALQLRVEELESAADSAAAMNASGAVRASRSDASPSVRTSVEALIDAGIDEEQAFWIQERLDEIDLQQLYLQDRATREGWLNKPRYHQERRKYLNAVTELRNELDDDTYDRMLYTLGRANRVVIRDIMQNSAAAQYGLQDGDQIIEYGGQRIFSSNELSTLVVQGSAGVMTLVRVKRAGEVHDIYLPRGPLGIRMTAARLAP